MYICLYKKAAGEFFLEQFVFIAKWYDHQINLRQTILSADLSRPGVFLGEFYLKSNSFHTQAISLYVP
jgi:hypothetical protein